MALTFVSSSPSNGETGVLLNPSISVVFNSALSATYVTKSSIFLRDTLTNAVVESSPTINADGVSVSVVPASVLKEYTSYDIVLLGADDDSEHAIQNTSGDKLATTIVIRFTTGDKLHTHDQTYEAKTSGDYTREGDLYLPSNVRLISEELRIVSTTPSGYSNDQDYSSIAITFNKALSGYDASISFQPMLDTDAYVALSGEFLTGTFTAPSGEFFLDTGDPSILRWTGQPGYQNLYVEVSIGTGTYSTDGDGYPGSSFGFNSTLYPSIAGTYSLRREIPAINEVRDDYLGFLLLRNAIWLWERTGRAYDLDNPPYSALSYVLNQSIVDVIEDKDLEKSLVAGTRRQLGDLNVSVDNLVGRNALKYTRAKEAADNALLTILKPVNVKRAGIADSYVVAQGSRMWWGAVGKYRESYWSKYQAQRPAANTYIQRQAKVPPYWFFI